MGKMGKVNRIKLQSIRRISFIVFVVLCTSSSNIVTSERPSHVENLLLQESVVRTNHGVMVMKLSPRKTLLSLKNGEKSGMMTPGVDEEEGGENMNHDGSNRRRHHLHYQQHPSSANKPAIIFARALPPPNKSSLTTLLDNSKDDDALHGNQTETKSNLSSGSSLQNHDESSQQQFFGSLEGNASGGDDDFDNENESGGGGGDRGLLLSQSALRNGTDSSLLASSSSSVEGNGPITRVQPEIGQVWLSKEGGGGGDIKSIEENDLQTLIAGFLKREIWTIPLFVFASLNIVLITFFEIYVLCRTKGQSRGHLFLGQMLLLGLFFCSTLALLFAIYPSMMICFVFRIGLGFSYSLVFSVLMVKCMFLLCLDVGVYLPTMYQGSLLFFSVLVQIVLDTQWTMLFPPVFQDSDLVREESVFLQCGTSYSLLLCSLWYIAFLVLLVGFLAAKATFRGIADNYRESIYILMSMIVTVPISISWILAGWILEGREQDACVAFGLVAQSLTIFLIMFMPKGRQLAAMGKDVALAYEEDDQFSRYSPSFFHFKPSNKSCKAAAVFGDGNLYTTLTEPTLSTINPNVFFHRADYHSGMIY